MKTIRSTFKKARKTATQLQTELDPGPSTHAPMLSNLSVCCVIKGESVTFQADVPAQARVIALKKEIQRERQMSTLRDIDPHTLELWKPRDVNAIVAQPADTLVERIESMGASLSEFADKLEPSEHLLNIFSTQPSEDHIQIVVTIEDPNKPRRIETPQTPVITYAAPPQKETPPRLRSRDLTPAMEEALKPFTKYMTDLAEGKLDRYFDPTQLEPWSPQAGVTLPSGPMLLLHDLGNHPDDQRLTGIFQSDDQRLTGIFQSDTVHLFAVSGSGKTRLCLEGLCHQWGFYISCRGASKNRAAGSLDFLIATQIMTQMSSWDGRTEGPVPNKNIRVSRRAFTMLICARLFVLKHLLEKFPPGTDAKTARRRWVLVQAMPPSVRHLTDIFTTILESLRRADSGEMRDLNKSMLADMTKIIGHLIFPFNQQFVAVIDEAQVAAEYTDESFCSLTTGVKRPVLHPFYRFLHDSDLFNGIILVGTDLSINMVQKAVFFGSAQRLDESRNPIIFHDVGRFSNNGTDHRTYVEKYLTFPPTDSDNRLRRRILYWLSGRYRFTASFIELLLFTKIASRHRILTAFIHALTGFHVTDAIDLEEKEPPLPPLLLNHIANFYGSAGGVDRLLGKLNGSDLKYIFNALMRWRIGTQSTTIRIEGDVHQTIASGIGHLKMVEPVQLFDTEDRYFAYLCEPLVVLYLSSVFAKRPETMHLSWLSDATLTARNNSSLGFLFEEAVLMIILQMFGGEPRCLSDAFHTDQPWGSRKVVLVSLKREADEVLSCPVSWTSGSSDRLGFKANSPSQVLEFLDKPDGKCFLFPDTHMGPDLSCYFQDWESKELISANFQQKLKETLRPAEWRRCVQTVTPQLFYTVKKEGNRVQYAPSKYPGLLDDVMETLDMKLGPAEYNPLMSDDRPKTRSVGKQEGISTSQPQRQTPRFLRIIATPNDHQRERLKAEWKGDVAVLRSECVQQYFPDVVWGTPDSVA